MLLNDTKLVLLTTFLINVEGESFVLGLENGNQRDTTPCSNHFRTAYNRKLLIYIETSRKEGMVKITAKAIISKQKTSLLNGEKQLK